MASVEDNLYTTLVGNSTLTALTSTRIEPIMNAQGTAFPRVVYTKTADAPIYASSGPTSLKLATFAIECQARTVSEAENVRDAVKNIINGVSGTFGGALMKRSGINNESDIVYPPAGGEETVVVGKVIEIDVYYI